MNPEKHDDQALRPPGPPEPEIHRAARVGDLAALERLVAANKGDIDLRSDLAFDHGTLLNRLTPLMVAAGSLDGASLDTVRWLVDHGADVHAKSAGLCTAAWYAAGGLESSFYFQGMQRRTDHVERLAFLLDLGLDANECTSNGRSLLTEACRSGDARRVRLLLEKGAKPRPADSVGERPYSFQIPLFCAAESGSAECVELILESGEDPDIRENMARTPLMAARTAEAAQALVLAGANVHAEDEFVGDVLQVLLQDASDGASACDQLGVARVVINAGADIEWRDQFGHTRLYSMAFSRAAASVEFLLEMGAGLFSTQGESGTPLHAVCWQGESDDETNRATARIIRTLIQAGLDANARDDDGNTPLMEAAGGDWGNVTAIRALVDHGADVNLANKHGSTPLIIAAATGEMDCLTELLKSGADPSQIDANGRTALDYAKEHREIWVGIINDPPQIDIVTGESPEELAARHRAQQRNAARCVELLRKAVGN